MSQTKIQGIEISNVCKLHDPQQVTIQVEGAWYSPLVLDDCLKLRSFPTPQETLTFASDLFERGLLRQVQHGSITGANYDEGSSGESEG
jgi:hypothetical protein